MLDKRICDKQLLNLHLLHLCETTETCLRACVPASGRLRPAGPRHDNDHADYRKVQLVPTCGELLCREDPYLPENRWVGVGVDRSR